MVAPLGRLRRTWSDAGTPTNQDDFANRDSDGVFISTANANTATNKMEPMLNGYRVQSLPVHLHSPKTSRLLQRKWLCLAPNQQPR
jgi:hypothetical protein